ncbi:tRNA uridine-5-carboxymethylaminomethyl(34) synthesis GTPase MnmE [Methylibium sp.]|uniref:tRNA uridine-5-carboxymethylaminomethyl(34) synthesis GTPase MnmE n=1 Tax=Methylibium sp. TaxID=2067992 RepID=UPI0017F9A93D|nr:tRNA uridine-5-carboxymethylaminomethyl(34) synthesis GTPase MnmE [Methylibium sp.]MBA3588765.1 tRNA uridine-5-carboxymethylaminomethyl(34) synthesis GTPase MnmE [Methylibium sp.]
MLARLHDAIAAIASAPGRGAVGIVRVSGRDLGGLVKAVCGQALAPRHAHYLGFLDSQGGVIDQGLALHFPAPHSYTGEEVLELQAHGGPVLLQLLLARCLQALPGARLAEPGEFTQRAFLNDKLDLAQAEAVADLIDASTEAAARSASRALTGAFSHEIDGLRDRLIELRMLVEATLDFPEEEIDFLQQADARGRLARIAAALDAVLARARQGALLREGLRVVLAGQPNVGKSSLLNALAGAELAIVTPIPGTTRDKVSETIQIEGVPLHVIDTAGLRTDGEASDEVERLGIERSWGAIGSADVVIFLHDLTRGDDAAYRAGEHEISCRLPPGVSVLDVYNKIDAVDAQVMPADALALSARTGDGLEALRQRLLQLAGWQAGAEGVFIARARHLEALHATRAHVEQAQALAARDDAALDLLAEELRCAHDALGAITGRFTADDLLGEIFGRFCIGK